MNLEHERRETIVQLLHGGAEPAAILEETIGRRREAFGAGSHHLIIDPLELDSAVVAQFPSGESVVPFFNFHQRISGQRLLSPEDFMAALAAAQATLVHRELFDAETLPDGTKVPTYGAFLFR
jgi:hypothetical protein